MIRKKEGMEQSAVLRGPVKVMKSSDLLEVMLCSSLKVNQCFGGICHLYLQG
jgi:hypothetical protein